MQSKDVGCELIFILMVIEKTFRFTANDQDVGVNTSDKSQEKTFAKFSNRAFPRIENQTSPSGKWQQLS